MKVDLENTTFNTIIDDSPKSLAVLANDIETFAEYIKAYLAAEIGEVEYSLSVKVKTPEQKNRNNSKQMTWEDVIKDIFDK